jgi:UDP-glucose 4-epimerase
MKQKFLVTGGAGFIGTNLCKSLAAGGHEIIIVDNLSGGNANTIPEGAALYRLDIRKTEPLSVLMRGVDVVVHLAALPRVQFSLDNPVESHDVNVNGTLSVLEAAKRVGVKRIVYAASSSAYGDQETLPLSLDLQPQPKSPYALHKYIGEEYMKLWSQLCSVETISLRFFNVYGPHLDPDGPYALVIGRFLKLAAEQKPLPITGDGEQTRDFTHVSDVVAAIEKAAMATTVGKGEVLNVGAGKQTSINTLAQMIGGPVEYVPSRLEPKHTCADISQTSQVLGWVPSVSIETGIADLKRDFGLL